MAVQALCQLPLQVSWASAEPLLCAAPLLLVGGVSTVHPSRGPGLDRGPPPEMWLSLGDTPPQGLRGSCGLSLLPVAPSLVTLHPTLSQHSGPSFIHSPGGEGASPFVFLDPQGQGLHLSQG